MPRVPWPLPALLVWMGAWLLFLWLSQWLPVRWAFPLACVLPVAVSPFVAGGWRRALLTAGFPLAFLLSGAPGVPPWFWLAPLAVLLLVYPLGAWRDAPLFPTPHGALAELGAAAPLAPGAKVLDAGCGLGDGLIALRRAYPHALLSGLERSPLLSLLCRLRCPWAGVRRGDLWATDWADCTLVYLFQRPESMARAWTKAQAEMATGSWLVSLEFAVTDARPHAELPVGGGRSVWLYRITHREKLHGAASELAQRADKNRRARGYFGR